MADQEKCTTEKVQEMWMRLTHEGIMDSEILDYILGRIMSKDALVYLKDFADICGIEEGDEE